MNMHSNCYCNQKSIVKSAEKSIAQKKSNIITLIRIKISLRENEKGDHTLCGIAEIMLHAWVVKKEINERPHFPSCGCDEAIA